jgi:N-acetylgalactosamine kinase
MNLVLSGDIPPSAGLSSSSAIVVVVMLACAGLNQVSYDRNTLAEKCGEAEWYVGTRGGSGDHAAEILARPGEVSHIGFFPSSVSYLPFPDGYRVVVSNSRKEAHKSAGARSIFNAATAAYDVGFALLRRRWPQYADRLKHLRDVNTENLECDVMEIYRMVKSLPETCTRDDLCRELNGSDERPILARRFKDHEDPGEFGYAVRRKVLFGMSECQRSRLCADLLRDGDLEGFGEIMTISHNGDRVFLHRPGTVDVLKYWDHRVSDGYIARLIEDATSGEPAKVKRSALHRQSGDYGCGCEEIDQLVDISLGVPGVVGAQLSGAGLGGSMMALVREGAVDALEELQRRLYFEPRGLDPLITVCSPIAGASVLHPEL